MEIFHLQQLWKAVMSYTKKHVQAHQYSYKNEIFDELSKKNWLVTPP